MSTGALDPMIHNPERLRIIATLAALPDGDALSVTRLQDMIRLTPCAATYPRHASGGLPAPVSGMMSVMSRNVQVVRSAPVTVRVVPANGPLTRMTGAVQDPGGIRL